MAYIQSKTPLANLVNARMTELGINRTDLVERMVFANQAKGLRRLNSYLDTGQVTTHVLKGLPDVLGLNAANLDAALEDYAEEIKALGAF